MTLQLSNETKTKSVFEYLGMDYKSHHIFSLNSFWVPYESKKPQIITHHEERMSPNSQKETKTIVRERQIWENSIETCILPYVKQMASPCSMHETGHSKPVHWDNPEGWDGEGGRRRGSGSGDTRTPMADLNQCMVKTTTMQWFSC